MPLNTASSFAKGTVLALCILGSACNDKPKVDAITTLPALEISATHAVDLTNSTAVAALIPNAGAPWLGRVVLVGDNHILSSVTIEGKASENFTGQNAYQSKNGPTQLLSIGSGLDEGLVFVGTAASAEPEVYSLALETGQTTPLSLKNSKPIVKTLCASSAPTPDAIVFLSGDGGLQSYKVSTDVSSDPVTELKLDLISEFKADLPDAAFCTITSDSIIIASPTKTRTHLTALNLESGVVSSKSELDLQLSSLTAIELEGEDYLLSIANQDLIMILAENLTPKYKLEIQDGLSIRGLKAAKFITSSAANFGGGGYNNGLIAIGDADEDRIVFVSRSYIAARLKETLANRSQ